MLKKNYLSSEKTYNVLIFPKLENASPVKIVSLFYNYKYKMMRFYKLENVLFVNKE